MTTPTWQDVNARYLSAALVWLRARLEQRARQEQKLTAPFAREPQPTPQTLHPEESRSPWWGFRQGEPPQLASKTPLALLPPTPGAGFDESLAKAAADLAAAESQSNPAPVLIRLSQVFGLSRFEREVLLLCVAMELDTGIASLCSRAQGDPNRPYPTFALAFTLFDEPSWDALSPEHPLRYWRLIEINQAGGQPLTTSSLRADERIVNCIKGLNYLDDRLSPLLSPVDLPSGETALPPSYQSAVETIVRHLKQTSTGQDLPVIQLLGPDSPSKQLVAVHAASTLGLRLYRLPAMLLPSQPADLETMTRLWERESLLFPMALYVDALGSELDVSQVTQGSPVSRLLARTGGVTFLDTRDVWPGLTQNSLPLDVAKPAPEEQETAWKEALGDAAGESPALLAGQFNLGLTAIRQIGSQTLSEPAASDRSVHDRLWDACLAGTRPRLDSLAQRLQPKATWDDLVLPAAESNLLRQIAAQVGGRTQVYRTWGFGNKMSRGFGISALFAGDPGTGKTMAAEVIADQLRLNLYRIDLSAVVSKYIGETEKNLRRLFDAAEDGGAILFFDEADALFGKRSEVKDSHDRYANIEINYLLQRMEAYGGLAILATNMKSALDQAFMRRLRFVVNFPFPGVAERKVMWQKVFPPKTPTAALDFDALARLNLTGGNIQSIALNAAFLAAQAGGGVTQQMLMDAARTELRKLGRVVNELEFRRQGKAGAA
ncbi:MAG: ATP-binding protein [Isosphaerales bacterium]